MIRRSAVAESPCDPKSKVPSQDCSRDGEGAGHPQSGMRTLDSVQTRANGAFFLGNVTVCETTRCHAAGRAARP